MRTTAVLSTFVLSAGLVAGCGGGGGNSTDAYCKDLKAAKADFAALDSSTPDFDAFSKAIATFHKLADKAPSDISAEWKTLDGGFSTLEADLKAAGLTLQDLGKITQGQIPEGMSAEDIQAATPKLEETFKKLDDPKFKKAGDTIEKHAKDKCGVKLGSS
jgi:cytochrome c556